MAGSCFPVFLSLSLLRLWGSVFFCCGHNKTTDGTGSRRKQKKKRRKRSSSDNHAGIILISSVTNLRELLFPPLFFFCLFFFFCVCVVVFVPLLPWNTTCGILYAQQQLRLVAWKQSEKRKITPHFCGAKLYSCQKMVSLRLSGPVVKVSCHFWKAQNTLYHNERFSALIGLTREDSNARACWVG